MVAVGLFLFFLCLILLFYGRPGVTRELPLTRTWVLALFFLKLLAGLFYGYYLVAWRGAGDCLSYFVTSVETNNTVHNAGDFFYYGFPHRDDFLHYAFWNDLKENLFIDLLTGLNLVTTRNFYVDTLLLCGFTFGGWLRLIRLLSALFPGRASRTYLLPFLLPSFLFFYNGLHPDNILFALLAYIAFDVYRLLQGKAPAGQSGVLYFRLFVCFGLLVLFKIFLLLLLLPVLAGWICYYRGRRNRWGGLSQGVWAWLVIGLGTGLIFAAGASEIAGRRDLYLARPGLSSISHTPIAPTLSGLATYLPSAIWNGLFFPVSSDTRLPTLLAGAEMLLFWVLVVLAVIRRVDRRLSFYAKGWVWLTVVNLLLIGYTVTILWDVYRYRGLFMPFVLPLLLFPLLRRKTVL